MTEARRTATADDLLDLPEHLIGEILGGEVVVSPRPAGPHAHAASGMAGSLHGPFVRRPGGTDGPGGWWIVYEPELHLDGDVLVPDLAGWRRERMPAGPVEVAFELAPDWVCEILSPRTARRDRIQKMNLYHHFRVQWAWLCDPDARTLEVYRRQDAGWIRVSAFEGHDKVRAEPFDAVEIELGRWWVDPER